jgi:hypothetical protein
VVLVGLLALLLCSGLGFSQAGDWAQTGAPPEATSARECLNRASAAATAIELPGDQSAARRDLVCALAQLDPRAALDLAGGIRRPSDAARGLGKVAAALAGRDRAGANQAASTASRLLLRITEPERRRQEQRLLVSEVAVLEQEALPLAPELPPQETRGVVVAARARSDPKAALGLLRAWQLGGPASDRTRAAIATSLAEADPDQALRVTSLILSDYLRERTLWQIAEARPASEAYGLAQRVSDPLVRSAILASAAARGWSESQEVSRLALAEVAVARDSAAAQSAVALVRSDEQQALAMARGLPAEVRARALRQMAVELAPARPERAAPLLAEAGPTPEAARLAAKRLADADPGGAAAFAESLPEGQARDWALAAVAASVAASDRARARQMVREINDPEARTRAVEGVCLQLAQNDADAATALIGMVAERSQALRLRAKVAAVIAARDAEAAVRLLESLPPSEYRSEAALEAGRNHLLGGRSLEEAVRLASLGVKRDLALRWLLPMLATSQTASPTNSAESIGDPYLRALALIDVARAGRSLHTQAKPSPPLAAMIRPILEWEGM